MDDTTFTRRAIEAAIRIGLLLALVAWCFQILSPFITPVIWAAVIATALDPVHRWLAARMGGRRTLSAVVITLVALAVLLVPATLLTETTVTGVRNVANQLQEGTLVIPPPPERVADLPVIGESLQEFWKLASINLDAALKQLEPQLRSLAAWLLSTAAGAGLGLMLFLLSIMIAGFLLTRSDQMGAAADVIAVRLAGERGREFMDLAAATVRSVAQGVLGVALIQTVLAQIGMVVIGVPASGRSSSCSWPSPSCRRSSSCCRSSSTCIRPTTPPRPRSSRSGPWLWA
jgi:predicted PurR-regulated permease PerM